MYRGKMSNITLPDLPSLEGGVFFSFYISDIPDYWNQCFGSGSAQIRITGF